MKSGAFSFPIPAPKYHLMELTTTLCDKFARSPTDYFPREIWNMILESIPFLRVTRFVTVSSYWPSLVYQSVRSLDRNEDNPRMTSDLAKRFILPSLVEFHLPDLFVTRKIVLTALNNLTARETVLSKLAAFDPSRARREKYALAPKVARRMTNLVHLNLNTGHHTIGDGTMREFTNLTYLDLSNTYLISDLGIRHLTKLTTLLLRCTREDKLTTGGISALTNLTCLSFGPPTSLLLGGLPNHGVKNLTNLTSLEVDGLMDVSNEGIVALRNLGTLKLINNRSITSDALVSLPRITSLSLSGNELITNEGLQNLTNLASLELRYTSLLADNMMITDDGLQNLTNLMCLGLYWKKGVTNRVVGKLTNLTVLSLHDETAVTDDGLSTLLNLTHLSLRRNMEITGLGIQALPILTTLDLNNCGRQFGDDSISGLANLTSLALVSNWYITNAGISELTNLTALDLSNDGAISKLSLDAKLLQRFRKLKSLIVDRTIIDTLRS